MKAKPKHVGSPALLELIKRGQQNVDLPPADKETPDDQEDPSEESPEEGD